MSFGFSVGDFLAAGQAFIKAYAALKDGTGSAAKYQSLKLIRDSLGKTLVYVQAGIRSKADYPLPESLINAVTIHLDHCSRLLKRFDEITQKYAISLAPEGSKSKGKDVWRKIRWGNTKDETDELFGRFREQIAMVETLLALHNACRTEEIYVVSQKRQLAEVPQIGWGDNSPIKFIDACDRRFTVPYEWCLTWQGFCEAIRVNHQDPRERVWVDSGSFEIFDEDNKAAMISSASWDATVSPGKTLSMAMLKKQVPSLGREQECPTCGSEYKGYRKARELERVRCTNCMTWFQVSSQPRIAELTEDNSVSAPANPADDKAQPLMRIRRWHVVMEQAKQEPSRRQSDVLPSINYAGFDRMDGTQYHPRHASNPRPSLSAASPISPTTMFGPTTALPTYPPPPSANGINTPPDSRRTSDDGPPPPPLPSRQSLPSLHEAISSFSAPQTPPIGPGSFSIPPPRANSLTNPVSRGGLSEPGLMKVMTTE